MPPGVPTPPSAGTDPRSASGSYPTFPGGLWETVFEQAPGGMVLFDTDMRIMRANIAFADMMGSPPNRLAGRSLLDLIHPQDRERGQEAFRRLERRELTWVTVQQRCLRDDGETRWGEFATRIFWGAEGQFLNAMGIVRDVTDAVMAEAALRESEMRNWRISESNMMGLFEWRDTATISEANDAFLQMIGYSREELRAGCIRWNAIVPPDFQQMAGQLREDLLATGRIRPIRMDYLSRTGQRIPVLAGAARISWDPIRGIGFVLDLSEQRRVEDERTRAEAALHRSLVDLEQTQARLQLADRMASMGTLAAGVAHEINNPLGFVVANLGFAQDEVAALRAARPTPEEWEKRLAALARALGDAQEGANRVRSIVLDLRTFSRPDTGLHAAVDVRRVIDSVVTMAQGEIRDRARIVRCFDQVPPVRGSEASLSQLFLNLVVNAAQSIAHAAASAPPAGNCAPPMPEIRISVETTTAGSVQIKLVDTGPGLAPEHLSRIFDPFFTTRPIGRGTGLGLSICHGIVKSLGGEITAQSVLREGTTFRVVLPAAEPAALPSPAHTSAVATHPPRRVRILVVDDEPLMGSAIARVLAEHEVVTLTSARIAMSRIAQGERFDVILCDVMMPDFSGIDLYAGIEKSAPELLGRLVFVTGGAYTADAVDFLDRIPNVRLEKPLLPQVLHAAIAAVLPVEPDDKVTTTR